MPPVAIVTAMVKSRPSSSGKVGNTGKKFASGKVSNTGKNFASGKVSTTGKNLKKKKKKRPTGWKHITNNTNGQHHIAGATIPGHDVVVKMSLGSAFVLGRFHPTL